MLCRLARPWKIASCDTTIYISKSRGAAGRFQPRAFLCVTFCSRKALAGAWAGVTADRLIAERGWRVKTVRQTMQTAGMLGPAICLGAAVFEAKADISCVLYTGIHRWLKSGTFGQGGGRGVGTYSFVACLSRLFTTHPY